MLLASPLIHAKRAFGWNLGKVVPTDAERAALAKAGVTDPTAARYAVWRRSLLLAALVPKLVAFGLATWDSVESGFGYLTPVGIALELAWMASAGGLAIACLVGVARWTRPRSASTMLAGAWAATFVMPFVYALLPVEMIYHVQSIGPPSPTKTATAPKAGGPGPIVAFAEEKASDLGIDLDLAKIERIQALKETAIEFVLSGASYSLLLPAVLSLIPGAVNGCLRVKALVPAAQLPGWLLVWAAPAFVLFWAVILVIVNLVVRSPLLVFGVLLWAGAPIWYTALGRVFVQSQIDEAEAARIGRVKRLVALTTLAGIGMLLAFILTAKVMGLHAIGFDRSKAVATKIEEMSEDDEVSWEDVETALIESESYVYAFDLSSWRLVIDFLAKLLVVTAVFADLALRATLSAWDNERRLRAGPGATEFDATAAAMEKMVRN